MALSLPPKETQKSFSALVAHRCPSCKPSRSPPQTKYNLPHPSTCPQPQSPYPPCSVFPSVALSSPLVLSQRKKKEKTVPASCGGTRAVKLGPVRGLQLLPPVFRRPRSQAACDICANRLASLHHPVAQQSPQTQRLPRASDVRPRSLTRETASTALSRQSLARHVWHFPLRLRSDEWHGRGPG